MSLDETAENLLHESWENQRYSVGGKQSKRPPGNFAANVNFLLANLQFGIRITDLTVLFLHH